VSRARQSLRKQTRALDRRITASTDDAEADDLIARWARLHERQGRTLTIEKVGPLDYRVGGARISRPASQETA
jgi:hypothetical protein